MKREAESILAQGGNLYVPMGASSSVSPVPSGESARRSGEGPHCGLLIVNADDWGQNREVTDRILDCIVRRTISSVSAMVFMGDSERAAAIAQEQGIDAGLHLNLTTPFSAPGGPTRLIEHQELLSRYPR